MKYLVYGSVYWVVAYFVMLETQTELVVQADGYADPTADCTLLWCSWTARNKTTGVTESGRAAPPRGRGPCSNRAATTCVARKA